MSEDDTFKMLKRDPYFSVLDKVWKLGDPEKKRVIEECGWTTEEFYKENDRFLGS